MKRMNLVGWVMITAMAALTARAELPQLFAPGSIVLFQGDSITHGGRMGDMNHYLGHGYQAEIAMRYLAGFPKAGFQFGNRGVSGNTSDDLAGRWQKDAFPYTANENGYQGVFGNASKTLVPNVVSILIGVNDLGRRKVSVADYEKNLRHMITAAAAANPKVKIVLCEPFHPAVKAGDPILARAEVVKRLADEYNLAFVPFQRFFSEELIKLNPNWKYWIWDAVHPTYQAHAKMADFWIETVAEEFARGRGTLRNGGKK